MPDPDEQAPSPPPLPLSEKTRAEMELGRKLLVEKAEQWEQRKAKEEAEAAAALAGDVQVTPPSNKKGKKT